MTKSQKELLIQFATDEYGFDQIAYDFGCNRIRHEENSIRKLIAAGYTGKYVMCLYGMWYEKEKPANSLNIFLNDLEEADAAKARAKEMLKQVYGKAQQEK